MLRRRAKERGYKDRRARTTTMRSETAEEDSFEGENKSDIKKRGRRRRAVGAALCR